MKIFSDVRVAHNLAIGLLVAAATFGFATSAQARVLLFSPGPAALSNGLVGYWPLDGAVTNWTAGRTQDLSGKGHTGIFFGASARTSAPIAGKIGQALKFDQSYYIYASSPLSQYCTATDCTLSVWAKPAGAAPIVSNLYNGKGIFGDIGGYIGFYQANISGADKLLAYNYDGGEERVGVSYTLNQWIHLVEVHTGGMLYLYANGTLVTSTLSGNTESVGYYMLIGKGFNDDARFVGSIDDVRIYNRALSATEVKQLYALGTANAAHSNTVAISNGLVGYWPFDGGSLNWKKNQVTDASGNGNTGTLVSMSTSSSPTAGKIGQALKFDSVSSFLKMANNSSLNSTNGIATASAWIKTTYTGANQIIFSTWDNSHGFQIFLDFSGRAGTWSDGGGSYVSTTNVIADGKWHHVVGTWAGTNSAIYVDCIKINSGATTFGNTAGDDQIGIQCNSTNSTSCDSSFNGTIDDVRVYNRALSAGEVQQLYALGTANVGHSPSNSSGQANAPLSNGLVGYWTMDGPSLDWRKNQMTDMSGQGNTGTLVSLGTITAPVAGKIGQALKFDGAASNVSIAGSYSYTAGSPFTEAAWVYAGSYDAPGNYPTFISGGAGRMELRLDFTTGRLAFADDSDAYPICPSPISKNVWHLSSVCTMGQPIMSTLMEFSVLRQPALMPTPHSILRLGREPIKPSMDASTTSASTTARSRPRKCSSSTIWGDKPCDIFQRKPYAPQIAFNGQSRYSAFGGWRSRGGRVGVCIRSRTVRYD